MNKLVIDEATAEKLALARKTYGNKNQIMVSMEELCELACVLAKYPRYESEEEATTQLNNKVLDEVADVFIILNHVKSIFNISDEALNDRIDKKLERLSRWLLHSKSMQETIDDRNISEDKKKSQCSGCIKHGHTTEKEYYDCCRPCLEAQATEGIAPFYKEKTQ